MLDGNEFFPDAFAERCAITRSEILIEDIDYPFRPSGRISEKLDGCGVINVLKEFTKAFFKCGVFLLQDILFDSVFLTSPTIEIVGFLASD